jgi:hypothetical protein
MAPLPASWYMQTLFLNKQNAQKPFDPTGTLFNNTNIYLTQSNAIITVMGELAGGGTI